MTISVGDRIPSATLRHLTADGLQDISTDELFRRKKVVVFGLPGAFTRTCSGRHVPSFLERAEELRAKGVDTIACVSVNDAYVMDAWSKDMGVGDKILMLADGNCEFTNAVGLSQDLSDRGFGIRSQRYAMIVEDGIVKTLDVEAAPGEMKVSGADSVLAKL
ncbi:MAG: peroxiredoxin [Kiloniellales bacterium]